MQSDRHERISERAYHIWLAEGRVHGKDEEHWHRAEREIAEAELKLAGALADRAAAGGAATAAPRERRRPARSPSGAPAAEPRRERRTPTKPPSV